MSHDRRGRTAPVIWKQLTLVLGCFILAAAVQPSIKAQEPAAITSRSLHPKALSESVRRVVFDPAAFTGPSIPLPYWDKGYLISRSVETFQPGIPNVKLYDKTGSTIREAIWFTGSQRVALTSAAVTSDGRVLASGEADKPDGARARFIASTDVSGNVTNVIQTNDFYPTNICEASDHTVWSFGVPGWDEQSDRPKPGETLRHFDFQKGQIGAYILRSAFPDRPSPAELSHIRCSSDKVVTYSNPAGVYIEIPYGGNAPRVYRTLTPSGLSVIGFAVAGPKEVYGLLLKEEEPDNGAGGLYSLEFDETAMTVRWVAVEGAVGVLTKPPTVVRLWGVDGGSLVVSRAADPVGRNALHWATLIER